MKRVFSRRIFGKYVSNFMKIRPIWAELFHADGWTDRHVTKLIAAFRTFANTPNKQFHDTIFSSFSQQAARDITCLLFYLGFRPPLTTARRSVRLLHGSCVYYWTNRTHSVYHNTRLFYFKWLNLRVSYTFRPVFRPSWYMWIQKP